MTQMRRHMTISLTAFLALLPLLVLSYHPVLHLGTLSGFNVDISLLYVAMLTAVLVSLPTLWHHHQTLLQNRLVILLALFCLYLWISCLWSPNLPRAVVTAGFFSVLLSIFSLTSIHHEALQARFPMLRRIFGVLIIVVSLFAGWQLLADAIGVSEVWSLLPAMYSGDVFGVARPTGFALEPQFLANLFIIPIVYISWRLLGQAKASWIYIGLLALCVLVQCLTLSRGGLLAAAVGVLIICTLEYKHFANYWRIIVAGIIGSILAVSSVALLASIRNDDISSSESVSRVVSQLSLGVIDLPIEQDVRQGTTEEKPVVNTTAQSRTTSDNGYVASSTDSRVEMQQQALALWQNSPFTLLLGVGVGGFGAALHDSQPNMPVETVVNNFYLELLAETGLIGMLLFALFIVLLLYRLAAGRHTALLAICIALLIQWNFFSGTANAVHIWIIFGLAATTALSAKSGRRLLQ